MLSYHPLPLRQRVSRKLDHKQRSLGIPADMQASPAAAPRAHPTIPDFEDICQFNFWIADTLLKLKKKNGSRYLGREGWIFTALPSCLSEVIVLLRISAMFSSYSSTDTQSHCLALLNTKCSKSLFLGTSHVHHPFCVLPHSPSMREGLLWIYQVL